MDAQVSASVTPGTCPSGQVCNGISGFMVFIDDATSLYTVADWANAVFTDGGDGGQVPSGGRRRRLSQQQPSSLVTHIGTSDTVTTVAVDGSGGVLVLNINGAIVLNLTAPKLAAFVGQDVKPPYGTIPSLTYFLGAPSQPASYSVFPIATSPVVYNPAVLFDPYLAANTTGNTSTASIAAASIAAITSSSSGDLGTEVVQASRRALLASASFVGLPLSWTCFQASLSITGGVAGGSNSSQISLTVGSYAGTTACASQQVRRRTWNEMSNVRWGVRRPACQLPSSGHVFWQSPLPLNLPPLSLYPTEGINICCFPPLRAASPHARLCDNLGRDQRRRPPCHSLHCPGQCDRAGGCGAEGRTDLVFGGAGWQGVHLHVHTAR